MRKVNFREESHKVNHSYLVDSKLHEQISYLVCMAKTITTKGVIFAEKHHIDALKALVVKEGVTVSTVHADMIVDERRQNMATFINGGTRLLITSDACSRGVDLVGADLVINFNLPNIHLILLSRSTRVGRNGRLGACVSLIDQEQKDLPIKFARSANIEFNKI